MKTKYVFFWSMAIYAILTTPIQADVIKANSCSQQDVRAAIDKAIDGDTVWVPAGRCAWTLGITKNNMPAITLQGAGETEGTGTVLENQTAGAWENTLLWLTSSGGKRLKIEKFRFIGKGNGNGSVHLQGFRDLRVSHCSFQRTEGSGYMLQTDDAYGVIDHCDFTEAAISVGDNRDEAWTRPYVFGSSDATVIENCAFNYSPASLAYGFVSGWGGCRFVLRFNEIMNGGLNNHETCTSDNRGGMVMEVYKNTFISTSNRDQAIAMRGGTGVVFNNVFQGDWFKTINSYNLLIERARQRCDAANTCVAAFMTQCDHYPCLDQLGRQANQAWEPVYLWNNLQNGELRGLEIADCDADYGFVLASRDYFNNTPRPGYIPYPYPHPLTVQGENCRLLGLQGVENAGTVKLTWKAISGAAGYRVRRNWDEVVALGAVATEYSENAGGYLYLVEALSSGATVLASEGVITDTQKPTVPTDLSANLFSGTRIDLTWSSSTDDLSLSGYRIYRDGARIVISGITSYSDTNLSPHTQYSYTVTAFDAAGNESAPSSEVAVTTLASGVGGGDSGGGGGGGCFITTVTYSSGPWIGLPALFLFFLGIGFVGLWWGKRSFNIRPDGAGNLDLLGCNFHAIKSTKEKTMRTKSLFAIAFLLLLLINLSAGAANHYVCEGATGANNGSDWNNAFTDLPATLIRGNTYFIADGNYCPNGYRFDDPMDGDKYIKVLKATVSSHGTDVGWDDQYGDGQAVFTETLSFKTSYWVFDGVVGGTPVPGSILPDPDAYGFRVKGNDTKYGVAHYLFQAPQSAAMNYLQISHCALIQLGYDFDTIEYEGEQVAHYGQSCIYVGGDYSKNNYLISNNYMANASTLLTFYNTSNSIIENNYFVSNWSSHYSHGQLVAPGQSSNDLIFRNNVFYHPAVFVFGTHNTGGTGDERWQVYNNLVIGDGSKSNAGFANADSAKPDSMLNCDFHHNIFYNFDFGRGAVFIGDVSAGKVESGKSRVYNNIFYKVKDVGMSGENYTPGIIIHDYNDYYDCSGSMPTGPNDHVYTGIDPFVNSAQFDFRLKGPTQPGKALPSPYHLDFVGITRGLDGNWDRGAYEFAPGLYLSSPIGGETWVRGFNHAITWSSSEVTEPVKIELFKASALQWEVTMPITSGTSKWQIPTNQEAGSDYTIKISAGSYTDTSDVFTIAAPAAPIVQTLAAQSITASSALLRGTVHPMGLMTTYYFEYGLTDAYGSATADVNLAAGDETLPVQAGLSDLMASTTYHFRLMATNSEGATEGNDMTLTTSGSGRGSSSEAGGGGGGGCFMATAAPSALWWKGLGIIPGLMFLFLLVNRYGQRRRARHSGRFGWWLRILCKDKQEKIF